MMNTNIETKKPALIHPLWTHFPAIAALAAFIIVLIIKSPLPSRAPVHFSFNGVADSYGSPWGVAWLIIGISIFFIGLSIFLDEFWARQEKRKYFNWLSPLDDIVVGWLAGTGMSYILFLEHWINQDDIGFGFGLAALTAGGATLLSLILEAFRPYHAYNAKTAQRDVKPFVEDLRQELKNNTRFVYWDNQNPIWVTLLSVLFPVFYFVLAAILWFEVTWIFYLMAVLGVLFIFPYGGQRILVTKEDLTIRWGVFGFKVMDLKMSDITSAEVTEFSPLRDFGGIGIRFGKGMKAYFLRGTRGVVVSAANGKKYLLGTDTPEQLLGVIKAVTGK